MTAPAFAPLVHEGKPRCVCGKSICGSRGRRYTCPCCRRFVPYCFGADDEHWRICDDCRGAVTRAQIAREAS